MQQFVTLASLNLVSEYMCVEYASVDCVTALVVNALISTSSCCPVVTVSWTGMKCCCCPCGVQIWVELARPLSADQRELLDYVFQAWYALGRLGGFNSLNLQARRLAICSATELCETLLAILLQASMPGDLDFI